MGCSCFSTLAHSLKHVFFLSPSFFPGRHPSVKSRSPHPTPPPETVETDGWTQQQDGGRGDAERRHLHRKVDLGVPVLLSLFFFFCLVTQVCCFLFKGMGRVAVGREFSDGTQSCHCVQAPPSSFSPLFCGSQLVPLSPYQHHEPGEHTPFVLCHFVRKLP